MRSTVRDGPRPRHARPAPGDFASILRLVLGRRYLPAYGVKAMKANVPGVPFPGTISQQLMLVMVVVMWKAWRVWRLLEGCGLFAGRAGRGGCGLFVTLGIAFR